MKKREARAAALEAAIKVMDSPNISAGTLRFKDLVARYYAWIVDGQTL